MRVRWAPPARPSSCPWPGSSSWCGPRRGHPLRPQQPAGASRWRHTATPPPTIQRRPAWQRKLDLVTRLQAASAATAPAADRSARLSAGQRHDATASARPQPRQQPVTSPKGALAATRRRPSAQRLRSRSRFRSAQLLAARALSRPSSMMPRLRRQRFSAPRQRWSRRLPRCDGCRLWALATLPRRRRCGSTALTSRLRSAPGQSPPSLTSGSSCGRWHRATLRPACSHPRWLTFTCWERPGFHSQVTSCFGTDRLRTSAPP
mmetsp:Transcript_8914/g.34962  ORF Transcript_8914/g.34962 Transcript_8914/m.34962 type:complete len:262 (+) Transcript_8914:651-1436(+)